MAVLYLLSYFVGITAIVGVVLAYVWRNDPEGEWEASHWSYLITTFWMAMGAVLLLAAIVALVVLSNANQMLKDPGPVFLAAAFLAGATMLILAVLLLVRCILVLVNSLSARPMPKPRTLWI